MSSPRTRHGAPTLNLAVKTRVEHTSHDVSNLIPTTLSKIEDIHKFLSVFMSLLVPCAGTDGGVITLELSGTSVTAVPAEINKVEPTLHYRDSHQNS